MQEKETLPLWKQKRNFHFLTFFQRLFPLKKSTQKGCKIVEKSDILTVNVSHTYSTHQPPCHPYINSIFPNKQTKKNIYLPTIRNHRKPNKKLKDLPYQYLQILSYQWYATDLRQTMSEREKKNGKQILDIRKSLLIEFFNLQT